MIDNKPIDYNAIISAQQNVIDAQKKDITELEFINKGFTENKTIVSNYKDASKACELFQGEYMGQDASKLWEWAVSEAIKGE